MIATTINTELKRTVIRDLLLPLNHSVVGELNNGGSLIAACNCEPSIIICNEIPGHISLIDTRKFQIVKSFQAHLDEIKMVKVSESEKFIVTLGKGIVYI